MSTRPAKRAPQQHTGEVVRTEWLSPSMIRVVLGGAGLQRFTAGEYTDHYVKLLFPRPGVQYAQPLDMAAVREELPREDWPVTRTYTVRSWDENARELAVDFVVHGDAGLAGPWAARAEPGDRISFLGPGGGYAPDAAAGWHLLVGDESALPAIAAAMERLPRGAPARVLIEVEGPQDEQPLPAAPSAQVTWVHRGGAQVGARLLDAVRAVEPPSGSVQAFVHGEATFVRELRRYLRVERGVPMAALSISGYWRLGRNEDGWQSSKREWNQQIEQEEAAALA